MIRNFFKVALRNLWKNKGFSAINIIGLAVGLATCMLILFFVADELGYDKYNKQADRIYRVDADIMFGGNHFVLAVGPEPLGPTLKKDIPAIRQYTRFRNYGGFLVRKGDENVQENKVIYADSTLFDVFTLPVIAGNPRTALAAPNSVVLTERMAKKYFGTTDIVGKTLLVNDTRNLEITAVIKNIPRQSHFDFDFFVSLNGSIDPSEVNGWVSNNLNTYIVLNSGADAARVASQVDEVVQKYMAPQVKSILNIDMEEFKKAGNYARYTITPLTSIHLHSNKTAELGANSSIQYVYIFSVVAILVLLIACVNFMNLSTARSASRSKEVGVRKVLGSLRQTLIGQFLTESVLISFIALLLAIAIAWLLMPYFNELSGKQMRMWELFSKPWMLPSLLLLMLMVGLVAGSYPAFFLSAFRPVEVLKGKIAKGFRSGWLRSTLVVFQFAVSIILIVSTVVIYHQLNFILTKDVGFNREQVLVVQNTGALGSRAKTFKDEVLKLSAVKSGTMTGYLPTAGSRNDSPLWPDPTLGQKNAVSMQLWDVDADYIPTLGMKMVKGRNFSPEMITDSDGVIVNEAAAKLLGFKDPINQKVYELTDLKTNKTKAYTILGIVKNFNFNSLREEVTPLALFLRQQTGNIAFRVSTTDMHGLVSTIESKWKSMARSQPFSYSFMDEDFARLYESEQKIGRIFVSFALFAIVIACLGLFGLITYAAEQRTREIGIRKVLGASVTSLVSTLSGDFLRLVAISAVIAFPIAWWAMHKWLQDFAYRIDISWWIFVVAGLLAGIIALGTVCFQALRAATANPVKSLRSE